MTSQKTKHFKKPGKWKIYDRKLSKLEMTQTKPIRTPQVMSSSVICNSTTINFFLTFGLSWISSELKSFHIITIIYFNTILQKRIQSNRTINAFFKCGTLVKEWKHCGKRPISTTYDGETVWDMNGRSRSSIDGFVAALLSFESTGLSQPHCCVGAMGQFVRKLETAKPDF